MRMLAQFHPEIVCSTDATRYNLAHPYFDAKARKVVATDGHRMVVIPVQATSKEKSRWLPKRLLDLAREWIREHREPGEAPTIELDGDAVVGGPSWPSDMPKEAKFPDWKQAAAEKQEGDPGTVTFGVDARLLASLPDALGGQGKAGGQVRITIDLTQDSAPLTIRLIDGAPGVAYLMPCSYFTNESGARSCLRFVPPKGK